MTRRLLLVVASLTLTLAALAQPTPATHPETGRPFLTCFNAKDTGSGNQDWAFAQDQRGVLYVGDNLGLLEYDGATWRLIPTATNNVVRALDIDDTGRVFVGSAADFGYLAPDAAGEMRYVSLLAYVPEDERDFNDIWTVHGCVHAFRGL